MKKKSPYIVGHIPKLPAKYMRFAQPFVLSALMSGSISMINLVHHMGWQEDLFSIWVSSWLFSWSFAFPLVLILLPFVRYIVTFFIQEP